MNDYATSLASHRTEYFLHSHTDWNNTRFTKQVCSYAECGYFDLRGILTYADTQRPLELTSSKMMVRFVIEHHWG
jgi:hypothetical protein